MSAHTIEAILTARDQNMSSTLDKVSGKAESFGSKLKSGLGFGMWSAIGQKAIGTISNLIGSSMDGAVKRFDTLNNYPKVMQSLGFSAKEAEASVSKLGDGITYLPTTLDKVASQTQQVVAVTGDLDKATKLTLALNNAMAGGGAPAEQQASAINQWVQAMAKGKPDMQDWRALVQTAPAQMDQLSKSLLGATANQTDLYQAMQDGSVSIEEVNEAMIDLSKNGGDGFASWEEQAKNAGAGINMAMVNVKASIQRNLANAMGALDERLSSLGGISGIIQSLVTPINAVGEAFVGVLNGTTTFSEAIGTLTETIGTKAQELIPKGMEMVGNFLAGIAQQLPSVIQSGRSLILDIAMGIAKALPQLIVKGLNAVTTFIQGMGQGDGKLGQKAFDVVVKLVTGIIKALPQILSAGLRLMGALLSGIVRGFASISSKLWGLVKQIPEIIRQIDLKDVGRQIIDGLWNGIKGAFDGIQVRALR